MSLTDDQLLSCSLVTWSGSTACCRWCDKLLVGRQRRWCSLDCSTSYSRNHSWTDARAEALRRDEYRCTMCGSNDQEAAVEWWRALAVASLLAGQEPRHYSPLSPLGRMHERWSLDHRLEVDHVEPCLGRHSTPGCHHHLSGLRTLCHRCHLRVTAEQFGRAHIDVDQLSLL